VTVVSFCALVRWQDQITDGTAGTRERRCERLFQATVTAGGRSGTRARASQDSPPAGRWCDGFARSSAVER
jgi:hypothetical protein